MKIVRSGAFETNSSSTFTSVVLAKLFTARDESTASKETLKIFCIISSPYWIK